MAAQAQGQRVLRRNPADILLRHPLRGDGLLESHVEVLFPANETAVRSPEGQKCAAIVQKIGAGCKLGLLLGKQNILIAHQPGESKTAAFCRQPEQLQIIFHPNPVFRVLQSKILLCRIPEGYFPVGLRLHMAAIANVHQCGKNQRIHCIGRILLKAQISAPPNVIQNSAHTTASLYSQDNTGM